MPDHDLIAEWRDFYAAAMAFPKDTCTQPVPESWVDLGERAVEHLPELLDALEQALARIAKLEAELNTARNTNRRLNFRCQEAEHAAADQAKMHIGKRGSMGRGMANWTARKYHERIEKVRAVATEWAGQANDYDEDTEQQIDDGRTILAILNTEVRTVAHEDEARDE